MNKKKYINNFDSLGEMGKFQDTHLSIKEQKHRLMRNE